MNMEVLRAVANASAANAVLYVTAEDGKPLLQAGLITVNTDDHDPADANKVAAHITQAGVVKLKGLNGTSHEHKPNMTKFAIDTSAIELPKVQRGFKKGVGGGRETKYPFDELHVGNHFFVANDAVAKGDAVKTLSSAAGSANQRYAIGTGEFETVKRAKRGSDHRSVKDQHGHNVMEEVTVEKKNFTRKFTVRPVKAGVAYGSWTAPADGAVIVRTH